MKKFARCILILILVAILSGVGGYIYENNTMTPMYESVAKLYVVPGSQNEASIRAKNGGLNHDFMIIFSSKVVIESAQRLAGTSEDIRNISQFHHLLTVILLNLKLLILTEYS